MNNIIIAFEDGTKLEFRKGIKLSEVIKSIGTDREIICGKPRILIYRGKINEHSLIKERFTIKTRNKG